MSITAGQGGHGPARSAAKLEHDLRELVATIQSPPLRLLLDRLVGPSAPTWPAFRCAPAGKRFHHAYRHGLLEHSLSVAQGVSAISANFGDVDRDVAVTGALLHDIGKLDVYEPADRGAIGLSDAGRLHGEIASGYYRVRRAIDDIAGFPEPVAAHVLHIILSHHGRLEHGSPVVPATREATVVHFVDNIDARLGAFDRLERDLPRDAAWSAFDEVLSSRAYFGAPEPEPVRHAA